MAGKTLIGGTAYEIKGGRTLVNGTAYGISGGKTLVGGTAYSISFSPYKIVNWIQTNSYVFNATTPISQYFVIPSVFNGTGTTIITLDISNWSFGSSSTSASNLSFLVSARANSSYYFNCRASNSESYTGAFMYTINGLTTGPHATPNRNTVMSGRHVHTIDVNVSGAFGWSIDTGDSNSSPRTTNLPTNTSLYIFKNIDKNGTIGGGANARLYGVTIRNGLRNYNLHPAIRKEDNKIGLYDEVDGAFYPYSGTGTPTYG